MAKWSYSFSSLVPRGQRKACTLTVVRRDKACDGFALTLGFASISGEVLDEVAKDKDVAAECGNHALGGLAKGTSEEGANEDLHFGLAFMIPSGPVVLAVGVDEITESVVGVGWL